MKKVEVKKIPIALIKVNERAREDKGDISEMAESIKLYGLLQPITIDGNKRLLAGERRLLAHKELGLTEIDAIVRETTSKADAYEIELVENIHRKDFTWSERAALEKKLFDLRKSKDSSWEQRDQAKLLGISKSSVNRRQQLAEAITLLPTLADHETEDAAWKELKKLEEKVAIQQRAKAVAARPRAASAQEESYRLGDAFEGMAHEPDSSVDFAEVDSPFGVDLERRKGRNADQSGMSEYNEWPEDKFLRLFKAAIKDVYRILKPDRFAIVWYGMTWHCEVREALREVGFGVPDIPAIWAKGIGGQTAQPDTTLGNSWEPFFLARKGQPKLRKPGTGNVFAQQAVAPSKKIHPTEKPLDLMTDIYDTILFPGSVVMIPFLGSGVGLRALAKIGEGHKGFGWDLSEVHRQKYLESLDK
jgi:ParB/RepB/Spo0J family partition protein